MIGFNHIGRLGRRGNQMFQYAALRGIAAQNGYNFCFPFYAKGVDDGAGNINRTELFDCFEMSTVSSLNIQAIDSDRPYLQEESFHFDERIFRLGVGGIPDLIETPPVELGFVYSRDIQMYKDNPINLSFKIKNLLDEKPERSYGSFINETYDTGLSLSLGLKYSM